MSEAASFRPTPVLGKPYRAQQLARKIRAALDR